MLAQYSSAAAVIGRTARGGLPHTTRELLYRSSYAAATSPARFMHTLYVHSARAACIIAPLEPPTNTSQSERVPTCLCTLPHTQLCVRTVLDFYESLCVCVTRVDECRVPILSSLSLIHI